MTPQKRRQGVSRRAYATSRGVSERAIRKHLTSGLLAPAVLGDGSLDAGRADSILTSRLSRPSGPPPALADARKRKLLIQTVILADEVAELRGGLAPPADVARLERALFAAAAQILAEMVLPLGPALAGLAPHAAFANVDGAVYDALMLLSEADLVWEVPLGAGEAGGGCGGRHHTSRRNGRRRARRQQSSS
jgi:hypothetical protein